MRTKRNTADALENLQLCSMYMCLLRTRYLLSQQEYARLIGTSATNIWSIERASISRGRPSSQGSHGPSA